MRVVGAGLDSLVPVAGSLTLAPVVGDWVGFDGVRVATILPRRNQLAREDAVLAANVDLGLVLAASSGEPDPSRIERFVALVAESGIEPLVVLTKEDLSADPHGLRERISRDLDTEVVMISSLEGSGVQALTDRLPPRSTTVLIGMSGVGKSTLLNTLLGEERQRTLPVRERDGSGRHATVHRELFALPEGALLIDIPGMREPRLASSGGVAETFADVIELARGCRFSDCRHESEPDCAVRGAVSGSRLRSMRSLEREGSEAEARRAARRS